MTFVLTENNQADANRHTLYRTPHVIVRADDRAEVDAALAAIDGALAKGLHAAGYCSYELGYAFEPRLDDLMPGKRAMPLLWFGLFKDAVGLSEDETLEFLSGQCTGTHRLDNLTPRWQASDYASRFERVQEKISQGDIYQLNLTFLADFDFEGDPVSLYLDMRQRQTVPHGAFISTPEFSILSASPELFLRITDGHIETRPMKGTAPRGPTLEQDRKIISWLQEDAKSRAENLMIVDLMRNDISRISEPGSVEVSDLYSVETHPTLHQMTSGINARLKDGMKFSNIIRGVFPCGSITGAPKIRAMELIRELEPSMRGVYSGAIGALSPDGDMHFNVAIRTAVIDPSGRGQIGIGSGLVADSELDHEYQECLLKMRFLTEPYEEFQLIETLLFERGEHHKDDGFVLLNRHINRLKQSAEYFNFPFDDDKIQAALNSCTASVPDNTLRVRLLLDKTGETSVTASAITKPSQSTQLRFVISDRRVSSEDVYLYHKTTRRQLFDQEHKRMSDLHGVDEVVFLNEQGQLTEGSRTNIFIEKSAMLYTPRLSCGLLAGTLRAQLLDEGQTIEAVLTPDDLTSADAVYLGNSVRGLNPAKLFR